MDSLTEEQKKAWMLLKYGVSNKAQVILMDTANPTIKMTEGRLWHNTATGDFFISDGSQWILIKS